VLTYNTEADTLLRLVPSAMTRICKGIMESFEVNDFFKGISCATINEAKRLMYVGMTRPKEQLILTTYGTKNGDDWLTEIGCDTVDSHSENEKIEWGGSSWVHKTVKYVAPEQEDVISDSAEFSILKQPEERSSFSSKFVSPSKVKTDKHLYGVEQCGTFADRIAANAADGRDSTIGDFIHHLMCLWNGDSSIIGKLAQAYGVNVDMSAVAKSVVNFWNWMEQKYGKPTKIERESPFTFTNEMGQIVTGEIDLVYHTATGDVLVDYKTYQGKMADLTDENSNFYAGKYGGQLALYSEALSRNGNTIRDRLICYLSLGAVVSISFQQ
jgi:ATP-dependent exoDNAse (exonuclease V) beta subunit